MSRGGFGGGGRGGPSGMSFIPFEVDASLETYANRTDEDIDDWTSVLFPPMTVHHAPPPTEYEKKLVAKYREHSAALRRGPFYFDAPKTGKRDASDFNAFEDVPSYGTKRAKRSGGLPNLKKVPIIKELLPKELWSVVSDEDDKGENGEGTKKKNLAFLKKKRLDRLAQFDDGAEVNGDAADDEDAEEKDDEDDDGPEVPEDDDFEDDEDDDNDDYNAEKYFDDGDGLDDDGDGDAGGEDAW